MSDQAIRTWGLRASSRTYPRCAASLESNGPSMTAGEHVEVIELEPVLDLLERCKGRLDLDTDQQIVGLLDEHGRLK